MAPFGKGWALAALLALAAAAWAPGASADLPKSFSKVAEGPFLPGASTLHGDQLVWASPRTTGDVDFMLTDLSTGETSVLTTVASLRGIRVPAVAFDGQRLGWIDDRFGNLEAFTFDTGNGSLRRLTTTPFDETGITVSGGRLAWAGGGTLWLADPQGADRKAQTPAGFQDTDPCLAGSWLTWRRQEGETISLMARDLRDDRNWTVAEAVYVGQNNLHCDGSRVAWESLQYIDPVTKGPKSMRLVRWADLETGEASNVTNLEQRYGSLAGFALGHLAWVDYSPEGARGLYFHDMASGQTVDVGDVEFAGLSSDAAVVAQRGALDQWTLHAQRWNAGPSDDRNGIPAVPLGALAAAVLAAAGRRRA